MTYILQQELVNWNNLHEWCERSCTSYHLCYQMRVHTPANTVARDSSKVFNLAGKFDREGVLADLDAAISSDGTLRRQTATSDDLSTEDTITAVPVSAFATPFADSHPTIGRVDHEAWLQRRAGATFVEKLQVDTLFLYNVLHLDQLFIQECCLHMHWWAFSQTRAYCRHNWRSKKIGAFATIQSYYLSV